MPVFALKAEIIFNSRSSSGSNLNKQNLDEMSWVEAADGLAGALPATAGETARPPGVLCCSFVGNGLDGVPAGGEVRDIVLLSPRSWPTSTEKKQYKQSQGFISYLNSISAWWINFNHFGISPKAIMQINIYDKANKLLLASQFQVE